MAEVGTTSISQLPVNPQNASNSGSMQNTNVSNPGSSNIQLIKNELPSSQVQQHIQEQMISHDNNLQNQKLENYGEQLSSERNNMNVNQNIDYNAQLSPILKDASESGATVLPSRDIPHNVLKMQHDEHVKPNFVPKPEEDYIGSLADKDKEIEEKRRRQNQNDNLEYVFEQIQQPLLISIVYFIFQLPIIKNNMFILLPKLFHKDGNHNVYGYLFNSILFALSYYGLSKGINLLGKLSLM